LLDSVQTGETGFQKAFGMPVFDWLAGHQAEASLFNRPEFSASDRDLDAIY
jgi:hypothetical protein